MERAVAIKKLGKLLGKSLGYRVNPKASDADERAAAQASLPALSAEKKRLEDARRARMEALLAADAEYQSLLADYKKARETLEKAAMAARHFKITVGTTNGMFFLVKAEGDSWEDVIRKVEEKT